MTNQQKPKLIINSNNSKSWGNFKVNGFEEEFKLWVFSPREAWEGFLKWKQFVSNQNSQNKTVFGYISYSASAYKFISYQKNKIQQSLPDFYAVSFSDYSGYQKAFRVKDFNFLARPKSFEGFQASLDLAKTTQAITSSTSSTNPTATKLELRPQNSKLEYTQNFQKIKKYITNGHIYQINLTENFTTKTSLDDLELFEILSQQNQVAKAFFLQIDDTNSYLSFSPETFLQFRQGFFKTMPIKGTISKHGSKKIQIQKLILDPKEKAELNMITDLLRNDLGMVSKIGSVRVLATRKILETPSVFHAYSIIEAKIRQDIHPLVAVWQMLPAGSVVGCPKKRAVQIIEEIENFDRGVYTGVAGLIYPNWDMDWSVLIRGMRFTKGFLQKSKIQNQVQAGFGGGIVFDSKRDAEYQEIFNKLKPLNRLIL